MKVVEAIKEDERVASLTEAEREDLFVKMIMGKDVTEEVQTSRGTFTVKYPKTKDTLAIGRICAYRRDYKSASSFDVATDAYNVMASTLDVVVVSGPAWFEEAKKRNKNFSFLEAPSGEFIAELYGKVATFRAEVDSRIAEEGRAADQGLPAVAGDTATVDGGAFGSIASE